MKLELYKISDANLNTHKFGSKMDGGIYGNVQTWFLICEMCNLHVFCPDSEVEYFTTFDMFEDLSCDEMVIKNIIE